MGQFEIELTVDASAPVALRILDDWCRKSEPGDLSVVYIAGHGLLDSDRNLYIAARDTVIERFQSTTLPATTIRDILNEKLKGDLVVFVDCAHAGAFPDIDSTFHRPQWCVVASCDVTEQAVGDAWTAAAVEGVESGDADLNGDGEFSVEDIFKYVSNQLRRLSVRQTPTLRMSGGDIVLSAPLGLEVGATGASSGSARSGLRDPLQGVEWRSDDTVRSEDDALYRSGLASVIFQKLRQALGSENITTFLVHIDGQWGAGKSTLLRFLRHEIEDSRPGWSVVVYDAWRNSRVGPSWLSLLQAVRTEIAKNQKGVMRKAWFFARERVRLFQPWQFISALFLLIVATLFVLSLLLTSPGISVSRAGDVLKLISTILVAIGSAWLAIRGVAQLLTLNSRRSAKTFLDTRSDPMEELADHFQWIVAQSAEPVVVLIDDLDRCPNEFVVELLDSVQKLMRDRPGTTGRKAVSQNGRPLLVVAAADGRWIRTSFDTSYSTFSGAVADPGSSVGSLFLEKIFQLSVPVPHLSKTLQLSYLQRLLSTTQRGGDSRSGSSGVGLAQKIAEARSGEVLDVLAGARQEDRILVADLAINRIVLDTEAQTDTRHVLEKYSELLSTTPRAMKRFVMIYDILRAVRLVEGSAVGVGPLALWAVLLMRWPLMAEHLERNPDDVSLFGSSGDLPTRIDLKLAQLFKDPGQDLKAVMNHSDGPLSADMIRLCCGQSG